MSNSFNNDLSSMVSQLVQPNINVINDTPLSCPIRFNDDMLLDSSYDVSKIKVDWWSKAS